MSIEKRVVPFSRSFKTLIKTRAALAKPIKDLKDLSVFRGCAGYRHSGPTDLKSTRDVFSVARTLARETLSHARVACEGPRPTMKGGLSAAAAPVGAPLLHRDREVSPTRIYAGAGRSQPRINR